jgi:methyltransferase (TIGR00027 family)
MEPLIRDVSDTARWVAVYRARENERDDAVFRDPFARALAGERGERIAAAMKLSDDNAWSFIARTYLFDRFVSRLVQHGTEMIVNLAAGLDTRPYRLELPSSLQWVEVDLPDILDYKEEVIGDAKPACALERVRLDLSNEDGRRGLFADLGRRAKRIAVITEGFVTYLMPDAVASLARDLAAQPAMQHWTLDLASPGLVEMMKKSAGKALNEAGAPFLFAPAEGPPFFSAHGWQPIEVRSLLKTAGKLGRLSMGLRMLSMLPESNGAQGSRPWSAVCLFARTPSSSS